MHKKRKGEYFVRSIYRSGRLPRQVVFRIYGARLGRSETGVATSDEWTSAVNQVQIDQAFHRWIRAGEFEEQINSPQLLQALRIKRNEEIAGVDYRQLTWRFIPWHNYSQEFVLTTDKSDLVDRR